MKTNYFYLNDGVAHSGEAVSQNKNPNNFADLVEGQVKIVYGTGRKGNFRVQEYDQPIEDVVNDSTGTFPKHNSGVR